MKKIKNKTYTVKELEELAKNYNPTINYIEVFFNISKMLERKSELNKGSLEPVVG